MFIFISFKLESGIWCRVCAFQMPFILFLREFSVPMRSAARSFIHCSPSGLLRFKKKTRNLIPATNRVGTYRTIMLLYCCRRRYPLIDTEGIFDLLRQRVCHTYSERHSRKSILIDGFKWAMYPSIYDENVLALAIVCNSVLFNSPYRRGACVMFTVTSNSLSRINIIVCHHTCRVNSISQVL